MSANVLVHKGSRLVERQELDSVPLPPATDTWFPISHGSVLARAEQTLAQAGFRVAACQLALSRNDARFFGALTLDAPLASGVQLAVGIRNSTDKSFPIGFATGSRVFVCDNLSFRSEVVIARKHTRFGESRFTEAIALAVQRLSQFQEAESARIRRYQGLAISEEKASHVMVQAFESQIITHRQLPDVLREWREPSYDEFRERTAWSLLNAFTTAMADRLQLNPQQYAHSTIRLSDLLDKAVDVSSMAEPQLTLPA